MPRAFLQDESFTIIEETDDYVVIDKPAHFLVHPSKPDQPPTLWQRLQELLAYEIVNGGQVSIVNRLDRETSGLVLVAKNARTASALGRAMARGDIHKEYLAIAWGWPSEDRFSIDAPILRAGEIGPSTVWLKRIVHPEGFAAQTQFEVLQRFTRSTTAGEQFCLLRAIPLTGRTHQIRVHAAHAGYPLVGDKIYGPDANCYLKFIETGWSPTLEKQLLLPRHALHCHRMSTHITARKTYWNASLAEDLEKFLNSLENS